MRQEERLVKRTVARTSNPISLARGKKKTKKKPTAQHQRDTRGGWKRGDQHSQIKKRKKLASFGGESRDGMGRYRDKEEINGRVPPKRGKAGKRGFRLNRMGKLNIPRAKQQKAVPWGTGGRV